MNLRPPGYELQGYYILPFANIRKSLVISKIARFFALYCLALSDRFRYYACHKNATNFMTAKVSVNDSYSTRGQGAFPCLFFLPESTVPGIILPFPHSQRQNLLKSVWHPPPALLKLYSNSLRVPVHTRGSEVPPHV